MSHSPPNDPSDPVQPSFSKELPAQQLPASPLTSTSQFDGSRTSSPHLAPGSIMSPATSPNNESSTPTHPSSLDAFAHDSARRTSSKHRLSQDESDQEPNKRRRTDHDRNDVEGQDIAAQPFASLYRLSNTPFSVSRPHPALNLVSLYNLDALASSVARKDPLTGEKINKLRKSYEGKIKDLPGKNKAVAKDGEFFNLLNYPDEEWDIHQVQGKDISQALSEDQSSLSDDFLARLAPALAMASGPLPSKEVEHWRSVIDLDNTTIKEDKPRNQTLNKDESNGSPTQAASPSSEALRPRRRGTKRNYHDESFEGYEESFDDLGDGVSIDDDDRKSNTSSNTRRRKRRRDTGSSASHFSRPIPQIPSTTVSVSR